MNWLPFWIYAWLLTKASKSCVMIWRVWSITRY